MRTNRETGLIEWNILDKLAIKLFNCRWLAIKERERWLKDNALHFKLLEYSRLEAVDKDFPAEMAKTIAVGIDEQKIDYELLRQSKRRLYKEKKKADYLVLLNLLNNNRYILEFKLEKWYQLYNAYHNIGAEAPLIASNNVSYHYVHYDENSVRLSDLPGHKIPDFVYFPEFVCGYPEFKIKTVSPSDFNEPEMFEKFFFLSKNKKPKIVRQEPSCYEGKDGYYSISYQVKDVEFPAIDFITDIQKFYKDKNWTPLNYELTVAYELGGLLAGWREERKWSQCWINSSEDVLHVGLKNNKLYKDEIKVTISFIPHAQCEKALAYYRKVHQNSELTENNSPLPICPYEDFQVFSFPSIEHKLDKKQLFELPCYLNLVTGAYRKLIWEKGESR